MSDYGEYNGNTVHDMWVDYTYQEYAGGSGGGSFGNCGGCHGGPQPSNKSAREQIAACRKRIKRNREKIERLEVQMDEVRRKLEKPNISPRRIDSLNDVLTNGIPSAIASIHTKIKKDENKLISLQIERERRINAWTIALCVAAIFLAFIFFLLIFK